MRTLELLPEEAEIFAGLTWEERRSLAEIARDRDVRAGETLFRLGERADAFYVVRDGELELTFPLVVNGEAKEARLQVIGPGRTLAWSALVPPYLLTLSARAATAARLVAFPRDAVAVLLREQPAIGRTVMTNLTRVVASRFQEVLALYVREVQRNVAQTYR